MKPSSYINTWSTLRGDVAKACEELNIEMGPLGLSEWEDIETKILETFCHQKDYKSKPVWLWNALKVDAYSVFKEQPIETLIHLVEPKQNIYLVLDETINETTKHWYYEGDIHSICKLLNIENKVFVNEICLVSKKYDWLLCINHHSCLIAAGKSMIDKVKTLG